MKIIRNVSAEKATKDLKQAASEKFVANGKQMLMPLQRWLISHFSVK